MTAFITILKVKEIEEIVEVIIRLFQNERISFHITKYGGNVTIRVSSKLSTPTCFVNEI